jgi:hypothetical protein
MKTHMSDVLIEMLKLFVCLGQPGLEEINTITGTLYDRYNT